MNLRGLSWLLGIRVGLALATLLPLGLAARLGAGLGSLSSVWSSRRGVVRRNLTALGASESPGREPRITPRSVFAAYGCYWAELLACAARPTRAQRLNVRWEGRAHLEAVAGRPLCILTAHLGNWDLLAHLLRPYLSPVLVVVEQLQPHSLYKLLSHLRARAGVCSIRAQGAGLAIYRHLRRGGTVGLLVDRVLPGERRRSADWQAVSFAGGHRWLPRTGMRLARQAGAELLPVFLLREPHGFVLRIHPPLPRNGDSVRSFAHVLEQEIRAHPEQWCVLYPLHDAAGDEQHPNPALAREGAPA